MKNYVVRVVSPDSTTAERQVRIEIGQVTTANFMPGNSALMVFDSIAALTSLESQTSTTSRAETVRNSSSVRLDDVMVTLGTDTWPDNLYVVDSQGAGMRVRLAVQPLLPFQPGDIVSILGEPAQIEGELGLDRATVRLTDIASNSAIPSPVSVHAKDLATGRIWVGQAAQIKGRVIESNESGFVVEDGNGQITVPLADRKEFSVEAGTMEMTTPGVGSMVEVTGIVGRTGNRGLLRLRRGHDLVTLVASRQARRLFSLRLLLILAAGALLTIWLLQRKRSKLQ